MSIPISQTSRGRSFDALRRDLRLYVRSLGRVRGFSLAVIVTMGLCIGANTAILSVL